MRIMIVALVLGSVAAAGCESPEVTRTRGGRGADIAGRAADVKMHEGSNPYWKTPDRIGVEHPPLEPALQARELSRP
jgi:hypothetical protein